MSPGTGRPGRSRAELILGIPVALLIGCGGPAEAPPAAGAAPAPSSGIAGSHPGAGTPAGAAGEAGSGAPLVLPPEAAALVNQGVVAYRQAKYHEAAEAFEKARDLVPGEMQVSNLLGTALIMAKRHTPAEAEFRRALSLHPDALEPRLGLARIAIRVGDFERAAGLFREVLEEDPGNPMALYNLGLIRYRAGDYAEAGALLGRMLQVRPDHPEAHYLLGQIAVRLKDDTRAEQEFQRTIQLAPDNSQAHYNLANLYVRQGKAEAAHREQETFKRLWDRQASDRAAEGRARELYLSGKFEEALKEYDRLLELVPASGRYQLGRGQCFLKMGRRDEALAALEKAAALDPKLADPFFHLAILYQERGEDAKSEEARRRFDALEAIGENKTGF